MAEALFWVFAVAAVASALGVILNLENTVQAAVSLVVTMLAIAGLFFLLQAEFLGLIQVMVYAGAIVVLFLFVVMLLNLRPGTMGADSQLGVKVLGAVVIAGATAKLVSVLATTDQAYPEVGAGYGTTREVAIDLYTDYVLAFEVAGVLLLAGIVAAVVLAKRTLQ